MIIIIVIVIILIMAVIWSNWKRFRTHIVF